MFHLTSGLCLRKRLGLSVAPILIAVCDELVHVLLRLDYQARARILGWTILIVILLVVTVATWLDLRGGGVIVIPMSEGFDSGPALSVQLGIHPAVFGEMVMIRFICLLVGF